MCFEELTVQGNLKPKASTEHSVDLPQVTICPGPVSEPGGLCNCGNFPGRLVGPVMALAHAFSLPAISVPQCEWSGAISKAILAQAGRNRLADAEHRRARVARRVAPDDAD